MEILKIDGSNYISDAKQNGRDIDVGDEVVMRVPQVFNFMEISDLLQLRRGAKGKIVRKYHAKAPNGQILFYKVEVEFPEERWPTYYNFWRWFTRNHSILQKNVKEGTGWGFLGDRIKYLEVVKIP